MYSRIMLSLFLLLSCYGIAGLGAENTKASRHLVLLQETTHSVTPPRNGFLNTCKTLRYVEDNDAIYPSGFFQTIEAGEDGIIGYTAEYDYNLTHSTVYENGVTTYYYRVWDDTTEVAGYYNVFSIDSEGRVIYTWRGDASHSSMTKVYNPDTDLLESIISSYDNTSSIVYNKYTYQYDAQNRPSICNVFTSSDSVNWLHTETDSLQYGSPLSYSLNLEQPETYNEFFHQFMINPVYKIEAMHKHYIQTGDTREVFYQYTQQPDYLDIMITLDTLFWQMDYNTFRFDLSGRMIGRGTGFEFGGMNSYNTGYVWGEYVSIQDEIASPPIVCIYPNPMNKFAVIRLDAKKSEKTAEITIYNIKGQKIRNWTHLKTTEQIWDGNDNANNPVSSGIYLVKVKQDNRITTTKVMKL